MCEVENTEPGLEMWMQWVPANGSVMAEQTNITLRDKDTFFLVLYNITRDSELVYECMLFSQHSSQPLDKKTVMISGKSISADYSSNVKESSFAEIIIPSSSCPTGT